MRSLLWRGIERHLRWHLTPDQLASTLGDLAEDLEREDRSRGRFAGSLWLTREALSVSAAYRARFRQDRRRSGRRIMGASWIDDARFAFRRLTKGSAASLVSAATIGCAIAGAAVTWSLLSALLLDPLPVRDAERLFVVAAHEPGSGAGAATVDELHVYSAHRAIRESGAFAEVTGTGTMSLLVQDPGGTVPRDRRIAFVSHDFFETLGIQPPAGREFNPDDDRRGAPLTAIVSDRYWRTVLGAEADAVGRTVTIVGTPATIIGIAPRQFRGVDLAGPPDIYLPLLGVASLDPRMVYENPLYDPEGTTPTAWVKTIGRLKPGATVEQITQQLETLPEVTRGEKLALIPLNITVIPLAARDAMRQFGTLLATTVGLLLLIGCITAGVLLLVRTEARRNELAVCLALGGTRLSLARGIVIEGALVAAAGVAAAVPLAWWLFSLVRAYRLPGAIELELLELTLDRTASLAMAACAAAAILLIAAVAAVFGWAPTESGILQSRASATPRVTRRGPRAALVEVQVAVALVLVAGASQVIRSLMAALSLNPGFDASRVITGDVSLRAHGYTEERANLFFDALRARLSENPSIETMSLVQWRGAMTPYGQIVVDGQRKQFPTTTRFTAVDDRYFSTVGIRVIAGRDLSPRDTMASPPVAVVSASFGRLVADGGDPIGHRIYDFYSESDVRKRRRARATHRLLPARTAAGLVPLADARHAGGRRACTGCAPGRQRHRGDRRARRTGTAADHPRSAGAADGRAASRERGARRVRRHRGAAHAARRVRPGRRHVHGTPPRVRHPRGARRKPRRPRRARAGRDSETRGRRDRAGTGVGVDGGGTHPHLHVPGGGARGPEPRDDRARHPGARARCQPPAGVRRDAPRPGADPARRVRPAGSVRPMIHG